MQTFGLVLLGYMAATPGGSSVASADLNTHTWACPFCEHMFPTSAALKHHARRTHDYVDKTELIFNKAVHSVGGLPTCRFCKKDFSRWQTLARHITSNSCPSFDAASQTAVEAQQEHHNEPADKTADSAVAQPISCMTEVQQAARRGVNAFIPLKHVNSSAPTVLCTLWTMGSLTSMHEKTLPVLSQTSLGDAGG